MPHGRQGGKGPCIGRRSCGVSHPKLSEIIHRDFHDLSAVEERLKGYNACFFCAGVSSIGKSEEEYFDLTYNLTMEFGRTLSRLNPDMSFCYVSGAGTDSSEKGRSMWARVKGKTENDLMKLPFRQVFNFRPGVIEAIKGQKNTPKIYKYLSWLIPLIRALAPNYISTLGQIGRAMINAATKGYEKQVLEIRDIKVLSER